MDSSKFFFLEVALANKLSAINLSIDFKSSKDADLSQISKLENLESLTLLNFPDAVILPKKIFENQSIKSLHFISCRFKKLPDAILNLNNLTELSIVDCSFQFISPAFLKIPSLRLFKLSNQHPVNLLDADIENESITTFEFKGNLEWFFVLSQRLKAIDSVVLRGNELESFPKQILKFKNLISLNLSENLFCNVPPEFSKLKNLVNVDLSKNKLTFLPEEFAALKKIRHINLADCKFKEFPEIIFQLKNLESLNLENHQIRIFPEELLILKKLKKLNVKSGHFFSLPMKLCQWFTDKNKELILRPVFSKILDTDFYRFSDPEFKEDIFRLFCTNYHFAPRIKLKRMTDLLKIKDFNIGQLAYKYLVDEPNLKLNKDDKIYFFEDESINYASLKSRIRESGYSVSSTLHEDVRIVVVNHKIIFSNDTVLLNQKNRIFISVNNLLHIIKDEAGFYLLDADAELDGLKTILRSKSIDTDLLIALLESGGIPEILYIEMINLYISYMFKSESEKVLSLLKLHARPGWDIFLENIKIFQFNLYQLKTIMNYEYFDIDFDEILNFRFRVLY